MDNVLIVASHTRKKCKNKEAFHGSDIKKKKIKKKKKRER